MYLDGLHQADDTPVVGEHRVIGTLAMALHPNPHDALVIGLGGGVTASAVARFEGASVDIVELSPSVIRGSDWFRHVNGDVLRRPNVHLRIDDGRNHLLMTPKRYDVITADIIQPFNAGSGNLYSLEYFQLVANALRDEGVMVQWIGHRPVTQYRLIARTFLAAFPHATVWGGGEFLVGTRRPLQLPVAVYRERLKDGVFGRALGAAGIAGFDVTKKAFVDGGFVLPEAKSRVGWRDINSLFVATDFGPGSLTRSGYPRIVKEWQRGTAIADAAPISAIARGIRRQRRRLAGEER
jgi:hypothetical protein